MNYKKILTQHDMDGFLKEVNYLHDSVLRELTLISRAYVNNNLGMHGDSDPSDA
jgi:hypothetical protein